MNGTWPYSPGFKEKDSANLEQSLKICIQGQFFVLNKTGWGTSLIFQCTPFKKRVFSKKKNHFEVALTPNELTYRYKILGKEKYAFFLLACKISAKSVQQKRRYCRLKSRPIFKKRAMFQFWGKNCVFLSWKSEIGFTHLFYPHLPKKTKKLKKINVFFIFWDQKNKNQPSKFRPDFQKGLVQGKYENH